jgi:hypothetical protein
METAVGKSGNMSQEVLHKGVEGLPPASFPIYRELSILQVQVGECGMGVKGVARGSSQDVVPASLPWGLCSDGVCCILPAETQRWQKICTEQLPCLWRAQMPQTVMGHLVQLRPQL